VRALFLILIALFFIPLHPDTQENNDFYDNSETHVLSGPGIEVCGEVSNPGKVNLLKLPLRSVMVREAIIRGEKPAFVGSYRYDGYSLFDILKSVFVDKKNKAEFDSVIDLLVMVENDAGEKVVFSWGEIYYPVTLHRILLATKVSPIVPSKTKEHWPLGKNTKLVCAQDLISERNLERPVRITVFSCPLSVRAASVSESRYSAKINLLQDSAKIRDIVELNSNLEKRTYPSVFYGRGRGFHGIEYFCGFLLKSVLEKDFEFNRKNIRSGYFVISGADGYRIAVSFSELFNRNDQTDFLIIDKGENTKKGRFRLFPAADFFSDRAVYAVQTIRFRNLDG
jgi:hypothetical protein